MNIHGMDQKIPDKNSYERSKYFVILFLRHQKNCAEILPSFSKINYIFVVTYSFRCNKDTNMNVKQK